MVLTGTDRALAQGIARLLLWQSYQQTNDRSPDSPDSPESESLRAAQQALAQALAESVSEKWVENGWDKDVD